MEQSDRNVLRHLAGKYIWWKTPDEALVAPDRVMTQVMDIGDYDDVQLLARDVGDDVLREVLGHAQADEFSIRSWAYWNLRLGLSGVDDVPPLPQRRFA